MKPEAKDVTEAKRLRDSCFDTDGEGDRIWTSQWERYDEAFDALVELVMRLVGERDVAKREGACEALDKLGHEPPGVLYCTPSTPCAVHALRREYEEPQPSLLADPMRIQLGKPEEVP